MSRVIRSTASPSRIESVEYLQGGTRKTLTAARIIIAAFTVQSVRILLGSATQSTVPPVITQTNWGAI